MEGPNAVLNVLTIPPGAPKTAPRIVIDGVRGAIFVYGTGGALIGSWARSAGTDPYGNVYPQGLSVSVGGIIGTGSGGEILFYSTNPGSQDHLVASFSSNLSAPVPDQYGNSILPGLTFYTGASGSWFGMSLTIAGFTIWHSTAVHQNTFTQGSAFTYSVQTGQAAESVQSNPVTKTTSVVSGNPSFTTQGAGVQVTNAVAAILGEFLDTWVTLSEQTSAPAAPAAGTVRLYFDANGVLQFAGPAGTLPGLTVPGILTATGGTAAAPTVVDTDGWHNVSPLPTINGGTATGRLRYKMTNDKCVMIDCALSFTAFAAQSGIITLVTLAAPYTFATGGQFPIRVFTATAPANAEWVGAVSAAGAVTVNNLPVGTNSIAFIHTQPMD